MDEIDDERESVQQKNEMNQGRSKGSNELRNSALVASIPILVIYNLLFFFANLYQTVSPQYVLRQSCLDLGEPSNCNTREALDQAAKFNIPASSIPMVVSFFAVGVIIALSNRLGRRQTLAIGAVGYIFAAFGWMLVFFMPSLFEATWKYAVIGGTIIQAVCGGTVVVYFGFNGAIGDVTAREPSVRAGLYLVLDLFGSGVSIISAQVVSHVLIHRDPRILLGVYLLGLVFTLGLIYLVLEETIPDDIRREPISLKKCNTFGQLYFILPTKSNTEILKKDKDKIFKTVTEMYDLDEELVQKLPTGSPANKPSGQNDDDEKNDDEKNDDPGGSINIKNEPNQMDFGQTQQPSASRLGQENHQDKKALDDDHLEETAEESSGASDGLMNTSFRSDRRLVEKRPRDIEHRNGLLMLTLSWLMTLFQSTAVTTILLYFLKRMYQVSAVGYSNILTLAAVARGVGVLIIFPISKKLIKTSHGEKWFLIVWNFLAALSFGLVPLCQNLFQFGCVISIYYTSMTFPSGVIRGLMINQVSQSLQANVLSAVASCECLLNMFCASLTSWIWFQFQDYPQIMMYVCMVLSIGSAIMPMLISDSKEDFNERIELTQLYLKVSSGAGQHEKCKI